MPRFLGGVELPKYENYLGKFDPQDHLMEFGVLSIKFMHSQIYLMCLFPRSLGGKAMEWFLLLRTRTKTFE